MPGIFRRLEHDGSSDFQLRVTEARRDDDLVAMIQCGELDVAFVNLPIDADECTYVALLEDEYVLVVDARARQEAPTLEQLAALQLIAFKTPGRPCQLTAYFESHNLPPNWIVASDDVESIYAFVAAGFGVALLPRLATASLGPRVKLVELDCGLPPRRIGIAWSAVRSRSAAARDFVDAAVAEAARFEHGQLSLAS